MSLISNFYTRWVILGHFHCPDCPIARDKALVSRVPFLLLRGNGYLKCCQKKKKESAEQQEPRQELDVLTNNADTGVLTYADAHEPLSNKTTVIFRLPKVNHDV